MAREIGVEAKVEFTGLKSREEVFQLVSQFDIALQPAVTDYASPLKMFEYLAAGCLIVAPRTANILEILGDDNAVLFAADDYEDFEKQLKFAIENIDELKNLRVHARNTIDTKSFTWQSNAKRVIEMAQQYIN